MSNIRYIRPFFAVTGAPRAEDVAAAAALGFKAIVSNLPDGESGLHLSSTAEARLAAEAGLAFRHIPATKSEVFTDRVVQGMDQALRELEGPVLAHCASGLRSALAWAAAAARYQSADCVLAVLSSAGFDLAAARGQLQAQGVRPHAASMPAALDCQCDERG